MFITKAGSRNDYSLTEDQQMILALSKKFNFLEECRTHNIRHLHSVYWPNLKRLKFLKSIKIVRNISAVASSFVDEETAHLYTKKYQIDHWIAPNSKQEKLFNSCGLPYTFRPFSVDSSVFRVLEVLNQTKTKKLRIGSFQRDTEGSDLRTPKWQKGPERLIKILLALKQSNIDFELVIAGPRRHYIIAKCQEYNIPFKFHGNLPQSGVDDINTNKLSKELIASLYREIDLYIVSSTLEGGPKSIIECLLCGTPIISTDVGAARDFLEPELIYGSVEDALELIKSVDRGPFKAALAKSFNTAARFNSDDYQYQKLREIVGL